MILKYEAIGCDENTKRNTMWRMVDGIESINFGIVMITGKALKEMTPPLTFIGFRGPPIDDKKEYCFNRICAFNKNGNSTIYMLFKGPFGKEPERYSKAFILNDDGKTIEKL